MRILVWLRRRRPWCLAMGSCSENINEGIDTRVGALVWVRRRNGSWWPGLVLSPDGLPRRTKGMPVKLLGKEDGSIDWYDLEKSKRIKAFRCGEYDECIRKAKASALRPNKGDRKAKASMVRPNKGDRSGRYARREDAIIHALELERFHNSEGDCDFYSGTIQSTGITDKQGTNEEQCNIRKKAMKTKGKMTTVVSPSVISLEYNKAAISNKVHTVKKRKWRNLNDSRDDGIKEIIRMRGLENLGSGVKSRSVSGIISGMRSDEKDLVDDLSVTGTNFNCNLSYMGPPKQGKNFSSPKRGRKDLQLNEVSKRRNRRRPLTKVLESTTRVILPSFYSQEGSPGTPGIHSPPLGTAQNKFSTLDSSESKKTDLSVVINNSSEYSQNSCDDVSGANEASNGFSVDETCFPFSSELSSTFENISEGFFNDLFDVPVLLENNYCGGYYHMISSPRSENICDDAVRRESDHIEESLTCTKENLRATFGHERKIHRCPTSHSKGQRHSVGEVVELTKEVVDTVSPSPHLMSHAISGSNDKIDETSINKLPELDSDFGFMRCSLVSSLTGDHSLKHISEVPDITCTSAAHDCEIDNLVNLSSIAPINRLNKLLEANGIQEMPPNSKFATEYLSSENIPHQNLNPGYVIPLSSNLVEVKVDVQVTYKTPQVPLVSLTSKLNGKAIVGHPITVQIMSGSSGASVSSRCFAIGAIDIQTRKTKSEHAVNVRGCPLFTDNPTSVIKKQRQTKFRRKNQGKYSGDRHFSSASRRKSSENRKPKSSPRKIRKLSSITVDSGVKGSTRGQRADKNGKPIIACVPVKLVFSRISEALGRLPEGDGCT